MLNTKVKTGILAGLFVVLCILDVWSTHLALSLGATEMNPIGRFILQDSLGLSLLVKLVIAGLAVLVVMRLVPPSRRYTVALCLVIGMEVVVSWNCGMIAGII